MTMRTISLTPHMREALDHFKARHGRNWKEALSTAWSTGTDERHYMGWSLRRIRNTFGPEWLALQPVGAV
jgi:hypothetical protein